MEGTGIVTKNYYGNETAVESWSLKIERHLSEVRNVWTFVSNHFEGFAPKPANGSPNVSGSICCYHRSEKILSEQERSQLNLQL
jgi:hypothetical protein